MILFGRSRRIWRLCLDGESSNRLTLLLSVAGAFANSFPHMSEFIGRLHPLLVHLPIGFLVLLGIFEMLARWPRGQNLMAAIRVILVLTLPVSLASIGCGWLLADSGDYDRGSLFWHRWLGTGLGLACAGLLGLHWRGQLRIYRWALTATLGILIAASHFGGSLTHGSDFLSWPKAKIVASQSGITGDLATQSFYVAVIEPIFKQSCVSCHGPNKAKGGLRLDTATHLLTGGDSGSPIEPPGATRSLLGKRLALPLKTEEHMPPDGKRQLTANELGLVRWWLDAGSPTDKTVQEMNPPPQVLQMLSMSNQTPGHEPAKSE